jgi:hypothetical protein
MAEPRLYKWTIYLIRKRGELLGTVEGPDEKAAIAAAIEKFSISPEQHSRLIARRQRVQHY